MKYPRQIYVIFPFNENGQIAGVYVGSSHNLQERIEAHLRQGLDYPSQKGFHSLMKLNGFAYGVVDEIFGIDGNHLEYDWISYLSEVYGYKAFNSIGVEKANWHRLDSPTEKLKKARFIFQASRLC